MLLSVGAYFSDTSQVQYG